MKNFNNIDWNTYSGEANKRVSEILNEYFSNKISLERAFINIIGLEDEFENCEISTSAQSMIYEAISEATDLEDDFINNTYWKARDKFFDNNKTEFNGL